MADIRTNLHHHVIRMLRFISIFPMVWLVSNFEFDFQFWRQWFLFIVVCYANLVLLKINLYAISPLLELVVDEVDLLVDRLQFLCLLFKDLKKKKKKKSL